MQFEKWNIEEFEKTFKGTAPYPSCILVFLKVLERVTSNRIYDNLDSKGLIFEKQFGFQKVKSTEHVILQLTEDITSLFQRGNIHPEFL